MESSVRGGVFHLPTLPVLWNWRPTDPLVVTLAVWVLVAILWCFRSSHRRIAGPKAYPLIGSTIELVHNWFRLHDWLHSFFSPDARSVQVAFAYPHPGGIYTVDPANVEHILKTHFSNYPKGASNSTPMRELFGEGIFATDGEVWKEQRRSASYEFSTSSLRDWSTLVFREYACKLVSILSEFAARGEACDLQDLCMRMTLDSTCRIGFGVELEGLSKELRSIPFAKSFDEVNYISFYRFCDPLWKVKRWLNVGRERQLKEWMKVLDDFSFGVIEKRWMEMADGTGTWTFRIHQSDLLSRFIDLCARNGEESKARFTNTALRDMILNFIIAGRDTTAVTLSWFFYMMTCHPKVAEKIVDELATVVLKHDPLVESRATHNPSGVQELGSLPSPEAITDFGSLLTYETLGQLHYLQAALSETLRLYPAVPVDSKEAASDDVLPDGTAVKKGTITGYVPYSMGRMSFLWGDDAEEFRPERWMTEEGRFQAQSPFKFTAFQAGPRTCLGKDSAYLQMKMTAALVLWFFRLRLVPGHQVNYRTMVVLAMQHGLRVTVSPRLRSCS